MEKTPFIEELYKDYIKHEYDKRYAINFKTNGTGEYTNSKKFTKHLIITNYNVPNDNLCNSLL